MNAARKERLGVIFIDLGRWPVALLAAPVDAILPRYAHDEAGPETSGPPRMEDLLGAERGTRARQAGTYPGSDAHDANAAAPAGAGSVPENRRYLQMRRNTGKQCPIIDIPDPVGFYALPPEVIYPLPPLLAARHELPGLRALIVGPDQPWRLLLDPGLWVQPD